MQLTNCQKQIAKSQLPGANCQEPIPSAYQQGKCLVLGFGSEALSDDGVPLKIVSDLKSFFNQKRFVFKTNPVGGLELPELLDGFSIAVLVDTIKTSSGIPGDIRICSPENFIETFHLSSQHDITFHEAIRFGNELGFHLPEKIIIFAVEVEENRRLSHELTEELKIKYPSILEEMKKLLEVLR